MLKKIKLFAVLYFVFMISSLSVLSCKDPASSDIMTEIEGTWKGETVGAPDEVWTYAFSGNDLIVYFFENPQFFYSGTFTTKTTENPKQIDILIKKCNTPDYIGKTILAIYKISQDTLTISQSLPGSLFRPFSFNEGIVTILIKKI